jgi:hypothetical protein
LTGLGQAFAPVAEIAERWTLEAAIGERTQTGTMALVSWRFAGATSIASGMPYFSTAIWILTPRIFLPPSMPRAKQLGAERPERLSMTTVLGSGVSPQVRRQMRRSRSSSRRQGTPFNPTPGCNHFSNDWSELTANRH